jgi:hypothetical protein
VGDAALPLEDPSALQLDLLRGEVFEETAPLAEEHRDDVELDLVEDAGRERQLRYPGAMDEHVLLACGLLGSIRRGRDVVNGSDQRPLPNVDTRPRQ